MAETKTDLTARQQEIYDFVKSKITGRGYGPTVREIGTEFGIKSPNGVMCHLRALENISRQLRDDTFCRFLKQSKTPADINQLLQEADDDQFVSG